MKFQLFTISILLCTSSCAQYTAQEILIKASESMKMQKSVAYEADCFMKYFDYDDTLRFSGEVHLLKEVSDTIFGGYVWYQRDDTLQKMYDMHGIYVIDSKNEKIKRFNPHAGEYGVMTSDTYNNMVLSYFLEPEKLSDNANGPATLKLLNDTVVSGIDCYKVLLAFHADEEFSEFKIVLCITKTDYMPILRYSKVQSQGNYEYKSIVIKNYRFNTLGKSDFTLGYPFNSYPIDTFVQADYTPPALLSIGTKAPEIKGKDYRDGMTEKTIDFSNKVTLIDYWYMGCPHCIEAFPVIDKLLHKYKDNGLQIFGINPFDNRRLERLPQFLKFNTINYPIYMVEREIPQSYNVSGYPTFYLIDRNGKVVFSIAGFLGDETEKALTIAIEDALK